MEIETIPVIDIFAGPGGLSEGFSAHKTHLGNKTFSIALSVEKDKWAFQTLTLRALFRRFSREGKSIPKQYYETICKNQIFSSEIFLKEFPEESLESKNEVIQFELGCGRRKYLRSKIEKALDSNKNWVLIGGPPCQAYSLAGRSRNAGNEKYVPEDDKRHYLYKEYLRIIGEHWPAVFVMENVKGILSSKVDGEQIFPKIISDLKDPGRAIKKLRKHTYELFSFTTEDCTAIKPADFLIRSEDYGIPQARHRVIILGVRNDVAQKKKPTPIKKKAKVFVEHVLDLPTLRSSVSSTPKNQRDSLNEWQEIFKRALSEKWLENCQTEVKNLIKKTINEILASKLETISRENFKPKFSCRDLDIWYSDTNLKMPPNHEARGHRYDDLHRYLFSSCFAAIFGFSPKLKDFPKDLLPAHKSAMKNGPEKAHFADRFRVQIAQKPSTTITCHISKDGHYYIHPDPSQCRSLTVREAARLQTFPDNYFFCGPRTEQFKQVGNAVPPLLAVQLAEVVFNLLKD